ncbi:hypothetical protein HYV30_00395 [Candidatus Kaiserbacteria bacterium]|nr:hypothetical protein [Candidatus Kaiserbacteria bacterium]
MKIKNFSAFCFGCLVLVAATLVARASAQAATPPVVTTPRPPGATPPEVTKSTTLVNPLGTTDLQGFILRILDFVIYLGSLVIIFMLVYIGFLFVKARGVPAEISKARQALLWTVVGALILLGSKAIALGIQATVQAISTGN